MTATETAAEAAAERPTGPAGPRRAGPRGLLLTPALVGLGLLATYLWISSVPLDSVERNALGGGQVELAVWQSVRLTGYSTVLVLLIAVPLGVALTRRGLRAAAPVVVAAANLGQSVPSIGLLALLAFRFGVGPGTALAGMVAYAALPVLGNTMTGLRAIDPALVEAGRGIGMSGAGVLRRVELPLAVPLILAGVRNALVLNVGTGTLAGFVNGGGLGVLITDGIVTQRTRVLIVGSVLAVALALLVDWLAALAEARMSPRGLDAG